MKEELLTYLITEKEYIEEEIELLSKLSLEELVEKGLLIDKLQVSDSLHNQITFFTQENNSRFRTGDLVLLIVNEREYPATIIENLFSEVTVEIKKQLVFLENDHIQIKVDSVQLLDPIIDALNKLEIGAPGWFFFQNISGSKAPSEKSMFGGVKEFTVKKYLENYPNLTVKQKEIILESSRLPSLLAVQGPPGTGKSHVLAVMSDLFIQNKKRVIIVAPTHQAVNNCLLAIHNNNPTQSIVKIGAELKGLTLPDKIQKMNFFECNKAIKTSSIPKNTIVGMTLYSAIVFLGNNFSALTPNVVLVDEAGQIPLSYASAIGLFGAGTHILFGDDAQMPPIYHTKLEEDELSCSIFEQVRKVSPKSIRLLDTTFRLNQELCDFIGNNYYYDNESQKSLLQCSDFSRNRLLTLNGINNPILQAEPSICWLDNNYDLDNLCEQINDKEAEEVGKLVHECLQNGMSHEEIVVVSPFRKQVLAIRKYLLDKYPSDKLPMIDTVERVQGVSVDLVIFSLASTNENFINRMQSFLLSPNRINVAISRAKRKAIVFGTYLKNKHQ